MYGWLTFYHHGHEVAKDYKPHMTELQTRIQKVITMIDTPEEPLPRHLVLCLFTKRHSVLQIKLFYHNF